MGTRAGFERLGRAGALSEGRRPSDSCLQRLFSASGHRSGASEHVIDTGPAVRLFEFGKPTYAIPVRPGEVLPFIPRSGFLSKEAVASLPGARLVSEQNVYPGPNPSIDAYVKVSAQRNIYRVPIR